MDRRLVNSSGGNSFGQGGGDFLASDLCDPNMLYTLLQGDRLILLLMIWLMTRRVRFMGLAHINNPNKSQRPISAKRRYTIY